jgi:hypothetical protein
MAQVMLHVRHRALGASANALLARPSEDDINAGEDGREPRPRNLSNTPLEDLSVERDYLGNVGNGWLGEAGIARREKNIARGLAPLDLRSEGHADNGSKRAAVQSVALNNEDGSTKTWSRANWVSEVCPPNFTLPDHHSELCRTLRAAR